MKYFFLTVISLSLFIQCSGEKNHGEAKIMDEALINNMDKISGLRIFFGHQSVGYNIMDALTKIAEKAEADLNIVDLADSSELPDHYFAHGKIGRNEDPESKCDAFVEMLDSRLGDSLDIALVKFCYIDINADTDTEALFEYYKNTISRIKNRHNDLILIHITAPLRLVQGGWKAVIKKMMDKPLGGSAENAKRNQFNTLLREYFRAEPIFDLARLESTHPDGSRQTFQYNNAEYFSMVPAYTYDSGHLNKLGASLAAKELVNVLAKVK